MTAFGSIRAGRYPSLVELLRARAEAHPERRAYALLDFHARPAATLSYAELDERARRVAARLQELGAAGERVLVAAPELRGYVSAFLGCLYAGAIAVPVKPPQAAADAARLMAYARDCGARFGLGALADALPELAWIDSEASAASDADAWRPARRDASAVAYLQYTSGSTTRPRGVMVRHADLMANHAAIAAAFGHDERSDFAGWLPLYHDMGLVGLALQPLYLGTSSLLMPPEAFLMRPLSWLEAVSSARAHTSGGPNFAYDLCARKLTEEQKAGLDLSCWRKAFNGAEPVRAETLARFATAFAGCGLSAGALYPCYGLAEATLFVAGPDPAAPASTRHFDAAELEAGRALPAAGTGRARTLVACGQAWPPERIAIVDPETRRARAPGELGEVWVSGAGVAAGYWNRPEETHASFGARLAGDSGSGPYLRTGDIGFLYEGQLHLAGRLKDLVIVAGRNHDPSDLEHSAASCHPAVRAGSVAAFAVDSGGRERLVVAAELKPSAGDAQADAAARLTAALREAIAAEHQLEVEAVVLLAPGSLPKTSSGKLMRHVCRERYLAGTLAAPSLAPPPAAAGAGAPGSAP